MFSKNHIINVTAIIIIVFINSIYMLVFSPKTFLNPIFSLAAFIILFLFIIRSVYFLDFNKYRFINRNTVLIFLILVSLTLLFAVYNGSLFVNKILLAESKLLSLHYSITSMQVYKSIIKYSGAFEIINSLSGVIGLFLSCLIFTRNSRTIKLAVIQIITILISPIIYLGIIVNGEMLFFIGLAILLILKAEKPNKEKDLLVMIIGGCISGIFLYFSLTAMPILIIFCLYYFRNNLLKAFSTLVLAIICFLLLGYLSGNIQLINSTIKEIFWAYLIVSIISFYLGWNASNVFEVFFASGILIFLLVSGIIAVDINTNSLNAILDRTYGLNFGLYCVPIILLTAAIHEYKVDNFLGKVLPDSSN